MREKHVTTSQDVFVKTKSAINFNAKITHATIKKHAIAAVVG